MAKSPQLNNKTLFHSLNTIEEAIFFISFLAAFTNFLQLIETTKKIYDPIASQVKHFSANHRKQIIFFLISSDFITAAKSSQLELIKFALRIYTLHVHEIHVKRPALFIGFKR